jgi:small acid-soluble spore protein H (minor)
VICLDVTRARQIVQSGNSIEVLHRGSPIWIEKVLDNNTAEISYPGDDRKEIVPVYLLVENKSV